MMQSICMGAYVTQQDAEDAKALRPEPQVQLAVVQDGDAEHPWRIWWTR
jgi:hypothetical protein